MPLCVREVLVSDCLLTWSCPWVSVRFSVSETFTLDPADLLQVEWWWLTPKTSLEAEVGDTTAGAPPCPGWGARTEPWGEPHPPTPGLLLHLIPKIRVSFKGWGSIWFSPQIILRVKDHLIIILNLLCSRMARVGGPLRGFIVETLLLGCPTMSHCGEEIRLLCLWLSSSPWVVSAELTVNPPSGESSRICCSPSLLKETNSPRKGRNAGSWDPQVESWTLGWLLGSQTILLLYPYHRWKFYRCFFLTVPDIFPH